MSGGGRSGGRARLRAWIGSVPLPGGLLVPVVLLLPVALLAGCGGSARPLAQAVEDAVQAGPGRGEQYDHPSPQDARAVALSVAGLAAGGELAAPPDGYRITELAAPGGDEALTALEEVQEPGAAGNGLYVVRPGSGSGLVVQVPHPLADRATERLGADLFAASGAGVLMVATAHRTAGDGRADVANEPGSVFGAVSGSVVGPGSVVLQLHGFAAEDHPDDYGDVVLSSTVDEPSPLVERMADRLEAAGFDVCVYDGERCSGLAGTRNVQAAQARALGAEFVHVEVSERVRDDAERSTGLVRALAGAVEDAAASR